MKLVIKNMVCDRCVLVIKNVFQDLNYQPLCVIMGVVDLAEQGLSEVQLNVIRQAIEPLGFELLNDKKRALIEQIKTTLIQMVHSTHDLEQVKLSDYLGHKLKQDYPSLSQLYSSVEGITIEKYFIHLKVERIKEFLVYDELNLTQISYRLGYSSLAHLSAQFKHITGMTPTAFKELKDKQQRQPLDKIKTSYRK